MTTIAIIGITLLLSAVAGVILVFYPEIKAWLLQAHKKIGRFLGKLFRVGQ